MQDAEPFAPFIARRLWSAEGTHVFQRRRLLTAGRIAYAVVRDVVEGPLALHAASLVYTTILSLVPLVALAFSVLKGFGVHYRFEEFLLSALAPLGREAPVIAGRLLAFVDRMEVGVLGAVGLAFLFYTAISVVQKVEAAFNDIWHVRAARPWSRKFTDYLSVLLIAPVLIFSALGIGASLLASEPVRQLTEYRPIWVLIETAQRLLPFMLVTVAFALFYKFLPYTRVRFKSAVIGGVVAGVIWALAGWVFALFVSGSTTYTAIYSAFASLVLFLIWLNVNWMILMIGASVAFYHQHPEYMPLGAGRVILSNRSRERLALAIVQAVGAAHYAGEPPPSTEDLRRRLRAPAETVERVLQALAKGGLLVATEGDPPRWVPARPYESTDLLPLIEAIRRAGEQRGLTRSRIAAAPSVLDVEARIADAIAAAVAGMRLKDLVADPKASLARDESGDAEAAPSALHPAAEAADAPSPAVRHGGAR